MYFPITANTYINAANQQRKARGGTAEPFEISGATASPYGKPIVAGYGRRRVTGVPIWTSPVRFLPCDNTVAVVDFAVAFGRATAGFRTQILKLWINGSLVFDRTSISGYTYLRGVCFRVYNGSETQLPDRTIEKAEGEGNVPAFRGLIYAVFNNFPLSNYGNGAIPEIRAEITDVGEQVDYYKLFDNLSTLTTEAAPWHLWDASRNLLYAQHSLTADPNILRCWDLTTGKELFQKTIIHQQNPRAYGWMGVQDQSAPSTGQAIGFSFTQGCAIDYQGRIWTLPTDGANQQPVYCIDPNEGRVIAQTPPIAMVGQIGFSHMPDMRIGQMAAAGGGEVINDNAQVRSYDLMLCAGKIFNRISLFAINRNNYNGNKGAGLYGTTTSGMRAVGPGEFSVVGLPDWLEVPLGVRVVGIIGTEEVDVPMNPYATMFHLVCLDGKIRRLVVMYRWAQYYIMGGPHEVAPGVPIGKTTGHSPPIMGVSTTLEPGARPLYAVKDPVDFNFCVLYELVGTPSTLRPASNMTKVAKIERKDAGFDANLQDDILWTAEVPPPSSSVLGYQTTPFNPGENSADTNFQVFMYECSPVLGGDAVVVDMISGGYQIIDSIYARPLDNPSGEVQPINTMYRHYEPATNSFVRTPLSSSGATNAPGRVYVDRASDHQVNLSNFIRWAALEAGYKNNQITISGIDDKITGALITQRTSFKQLMTDLSQVYGFDVVESEGLIKITRAGTNENVSVVANLTLDDLAPLEDGENPLANVETHITPAGRLPNTIELGYLDQDLDFEYATQNARRTQFPVVTAQTTIVRNFSLPIVMTGGEALNRALRALYRMWHAKDRHQFRLPWRHMLLEPSDVISLDLGSGAYVVKITDVTFNGDLSLTVVAENFLTRDGTSLVVVPPKMPPNVVPGSSFSIAVIVDVPRLQYFPTPHEDGHPSFGVAVVHFGQPGWKNATLKRSMDSYNYTAIDYRDQLPVFGTCLAPLGAPLGSIFETDYDNVIRFRLLHGEASDFQNTTYLDMLNGTNRVLVGNRGRWECVGFMEVTDEGNGVIALSGLIRGRDGTDPNVGNHQAGDYVFLINELADLPLTAQQFDVGQMGQLVQYRAQGLGVRLSDAQVTSHFINAVAQQPYAVANPRVVNDGGDLDITWQRRDREFSEMHDDDGDTPLSEVEELYSIDIFAAPDAVTPVRTVDGLTSPEYTYTAADQVADGFVSPPDQLTFAVYQVGTYFGRGMGNRVTLYVEQP